MSPQLHSHMISLHNEETARGAARPRAIARRAAADRGSRRAGRTFRGFSYLRVPRTA